MHNYLRAVGFSNVKTRTELDKIIGMVMDQPTASYVTKKNDKVVLTEISRDFAERAGITIRGEYDEKGFFHLEHYFPHFRSQVISTREDVAVNKRVDTDAFTGMCDDIRLGVSLIFYLQNAIDYMNLKKEKDSQVLFAPITLSGLSTSGRILFGVNKEEKHNDSKSTETTKRNKLIADAREGDQEAIDSLTIDDIDLFASIARRAKQEDIYSIVDTSFIPYGSESDNYSVVGTIMDVKLIKNEITKESFYDLLVDCNDMNYEICINKIDLLGEPKEGRRFKGNIWMQGYVNFTE